MAPLHTLWIWSVFCGWSQLGSTPSFAVRSAAGDEVLHTIEESTTWSMTDMDLSMDGSPYERELPPVEGSCVREVVLHDSTLAADAAGASLVRREYRRLDSEFELDVHWMDGITLGVSCESPLEALSAEFSMEADGSGWEVRWAEGSASAGPEAPPTGLSYQPGLVALLPPEGTRVGEEWPVDLSRAESLFRYGGELRFDPVEVGRGSLAIAPTPLLLACSLGTCAELVPGARGSVIARLEGVRTMEDGEIARIGLRFELTQDVERDEALRRYLEVADGAGWESVEVRFLLDVQGQGELLWNLTTGRAKAATIEADFAMTAELSWPQDLFGTQARMSGTFRVSGTTTITHAFGRS